MAGPDRTDSSTERDTATDGLGARDAIASSYTSTTRVTTVAPPPGARHDSSKKRPDRFPCPVISFWSRQRQRSADEDPVTVGRVERKERRDDAGAIEAAQDLDLGTAARAGANDELVASVAIDVTDGVDAK